MSMGYLSIQKIKDALRAEIERDVEAYRARGGVITERGILLHDKDGNVVKEVMPHEQA